MNRYKNLIITFFGTLSLFVLVSAAIPTISQGQGGGNSKDVNVVNTPTVEAIQSGDWNVQITGTPTVNLNNSTANPVWVRDVNEARQPHTSQILINFSEGAPTASGAFPAVPAGKRLVVEHVSVYGGVPTAQKVFALITRPNNVNHAVVLHPQAAFFNFDYFTASESVKLYFDAGMSPGAFANRNNTTGTSNLIFTISGYFIDAS
jgi:hypothetical protein